jgi:hypothetical protein
MHHPFCFWCNLSLLSDVVSPMMTRLFWSFAKVCSIILASFIGALPQSPKQHDSASSVDQFPEPWRLPAFEGFGVGMRIPGGLK